MLNRGRLRIAENLNSPFPCVFVLKQSLQRAVFGEQSKVFCFWIKLMAANERIKKALYSCSPAFVSVGIVSVYKSCLVHIDYWKGRKIPKHIGAVLLKIQLSPQLPSQYLSVLNMEDFYFLFHYIALKSSFVQYLKWVLLFFFQIMETLSNLWFEF